MAIKFPSALETIEKSITNSIDNLQNSAIFKDAHGQEKNARKEMRKRLKADGIDGIVKLEPISVKQKTAKPVKQKPDPVKQDLPQDVKQVVVPPDTASKKTAFDRKAYMRVYMANRRAEKIKK